MSNAMYRQFFYTRHITPVLLDCNFVIDSTNGNGLGQRNLKGPGIFQVFGHSTVPVAGNNVPVGYFKVFLDGSFYKYYGGFSGFVTQTSGTPILVTAGLTAGTVYIITVVGTTTQANWQLLGVPAGTVAQVGVSFIGNTFTGTGTGQVQIPAVNGAGIQYLEVVGDPNTTIQLNPPGGGQHPYILVRTMEGSPGVATAPANNSVLGMSFYLSNSSVLVAGE